MNPGQPAYLDRETEEFQNENSQNSEGKNWGNHATICCVRGPCGWWHHSRAFQYKCGIRGGPSQDGHVVLHERLQRRDGDSNLEWCGDSSFRGCEPWHQGD